VAEVKDIAGAPSGPPPAPDEPTYALAPGVDEEVARALDSDDVRRVREIVQGVHYSDVADLLERLSAEDRGRIVDIIRDEFPAGVLSELDESVRDQVVEHLGVDEVAAALVELDSDDALEVVEELPAEEQQQVLDAIPVGERTLIEEGLTYPEDSAGRLMQREVMTVPMHWTVGDTIDFLRASADSDAPSLPKQFFDIFVVDQARRPVGAIALSRLLQARRPMPVTDIMQTEMKRLNVATDQEDVAFVFRQRNLVSAPVVDDSGRLVGAITVDDVVDVMHEEAEEDFMRLGGLPQDDLHAPPLRTAGRRFQWLFVTLINNIIAVTVISHFQATIEQIVALAVLMPIVAAMGGNAGMQAVTVVVRGLATKELTPSNLWRLVGKELGVGVANGVGFAVLAGGIAAVWFHNVPLGTVLGGAMIFNMAWAGLAGTLIPMALARFKVDPAIAAGPFLTTTTDVLGFFFFLGMATRFLL
jgi:magnesium transporter